MSDRRPYSRVYWSVLSDEKFPEVRQDMRLFGSWTLMLIVADMAWPAPAFVPSVVPKSCVTKLEEFGIVDLEPGGLFRIHGLDWERNARKAAATRDPDGTQAGPKRDPVAEQAKPSQAETETSQVQAHQPARDPADIYWSLTGRYPTDKVLKWIDDLTAQYGADPTIKAMADAHIADRSTNTLLGRAQDILRAGARQLDRKERAAEQARIAEQRAKPKPDDAWRVEYRKAVEDYYRNLEDHAA